MASPDEPRRRGPDAPVLQYAKEHWVFAGENPPVGLILCTDNGHALARYALEGLPSKVMAANYRMVLPATSPRFQ